jgi:hypothetical protein
MVSSELGQETGITGIAAAFILIYLDKNTLELIDIQ